MNRHPTVLNDMLRLFGFLYRISLPLFYILNYALLIMTGLGTAVLVFSMLHMGMTHGFELIIKDKSINWTNVFGMIGLFLVMVYLHRYCPRVKRVMFGG